jgi:23S rRNA (uridine2552-2'-O)-methyltransferase
MSSKQWRDQHFNDPYVKKAQKEGYVCRAAYKLIEMNQKFSLLKKGMTVIDLGSAPGGWSQVVARTAGKTAHLVAIDLLSMKVSQGVEFIQGDFLDPDCRQRLISLAGSSVGLVMSDMAPNLTGHKATDQCRSIALVEDALDLAAEVLTQGGSFVAKVFQGEGVDDLVKEARRQYRTVKLFKPKSSRARSAEFYMVAIGYNKVRV